MYFKAVSSCPQFGLSVHFSNTTVHFFSILSRILFLVSSFQPPPCPVLVYHSKGGFFDVRAGRYPHPRICRKFTREGGAVSARHTQGSDRPLPGTPRPGGWAHRPARRLRQSKAKKCAARPPRLLHGKAEKRRPPGLHQSKVGKSCARVDFSRAKRRSVPPVGLSQSKVGKCARRRFRAAGRCARPGGEKPPARRKKNRVFFRPLRACIRKRGLLFRKKNR